MALRQHPVGDAAQRRRGGVKQRPARDQLLGLPHVRHDVLGGLARAGGQSGQRQRRAHQLQEIAPAFDGIFIVAPADRLLRKLALQQILKLGRRRQFVQAAPVVAPASAVQPRAHGGQVQLFVWFTHRWQVEQLVSVRAS